MFLIHASKHELGEFLVLGGFQFVGRYISKTRPSRLVEQALQLLNLFKDLRAAITLSNYTFL